MTPRLVPSLAKTAALACRLYLIKTECGSTGRTQTQSLSYIRTSVNMNNTKKYTLRGYSVSSISDEVQEASGNALFQNN